MSAPDPRAALMAALREMAEEWCVAGMEYAEDLMAPRAGVTLTAEAKEGGREWVRDYFSAPEDVAEDEQIQAVLAAVDAIEAEARKPDPAALDAFRLISNLHDRTLLTMQAAWIEWKHGDGAHAAMENWIEEALDGPGLVPDPADEDSVWSEDASEYFRLNHQPAERSPDA